MSTKIPVILSALALVASSELTRPPRRPAPSPPLMTLVDTERAFAKTSVERGRRAAFLAYFDDEAVFFTPEPSRARPIISKWPETQSVVLDWEPRFGDVARTGDLGYTTGPFERTSVRAAAAGSAREKNVVETGWYFSLWKKVKGSWKVAVDVGVTSPGSGALRPAPFVARSSETAAGARPATSLVAVDQAFCGASAAGFAEASRSVATDETIVFRDAVGPIAEAARIHSYFTARGTRMACRPVKDTLAASGDFGYTYGEYSSQAPSRETGWYLRVWKRRGGAWQLAIDLLVPSQTVASPEP